MMPQYFRSFDCLKASARNKDVIDWLVRKFNLAPFNHSFRDGFANVNIWDGCLTIRLDMRCEEQLGLFKSIPSGYKGTPQHGTGKIVNLTTLYFDLNIEFTIPYPEIVESRITDKKQHRDNDGDFFYVFTHEIKLSDGTFLIRSNQKEKMDISGWAYRTCIQERFFYENIKMNNTMEVQGCDASKD